MPRVRQLPGLLMELSIRFPQKFRPGSYDAMVERYAKRFTKNHLALLLGREHGWRARKSLSKAGHIILWTALHDYGRDDVLAVVLGSDRHRPFRLSIPRRP